MQNDTGLKRELFKEGIISKFEDELREQNLKIEELESKIHSPENAFKKLDIYGRRTCFHIHVILFKEGDDDDVMKRQKNIVMSQIFHLMKMKLTERVVSESPSWTRNEKRKLEQ